jgi:hypothetical protein
MVCVRERFARPLAPREDLVGLEVDGDGLHRHALTLRLLATIEERAVVEKILTHLGLPVDLPQPSAARTPECP